MTGLILALVTLVGAAPPAVSSGDALFARGDFDQARTAYADALSRDPKDADALLGAALTALYDNRLQEAARSATAASALSPGDAGAARILDTIAKRQMIAVSAKALDVPADGVVVPFVSNEPLPAVELQIDGKPATLVIDTGAPDLTLDPAFVKELGLKVTQGDVGTFLGGRKAPVERTVVHSVTTGAITLRDVATNVLPSRELRLAGGRSVDGVLGTPFLSRFLATMDYPNHRLVLRPQGTPPIANPNAVSMPMWLVGDHMIFARGSVNALADCLFSVDSGGAGVGFMPTAQTVADARITTMADQKREGIGGGGSVEIIPTLANNVCLGSVCQTNVPGGYTPNGSPLSTFPFAVAGTVSHAFLERYAVTYDFVHMQLTLAPPQ